MGSGTELLRKTRDFLTGNPGLIPSRHANKLGIQASYK